jgi:hypothetical protein
MQIQGLVIILDYERDTNSALFRHKEHLRFVKGKDLREFLRALLPNEAFSVSERPMGLYLCQIRKPADKDLELDMMRAELDLIRSMRLAEKEFTLGEMAKMLGSG